MKAYSSALAVTSLAVLVPLLHVVTANFGYDDCCGMGYERPYIWWERHCSYGRPPHHSCRRPPPPPPPASNPYGCGYGGCATGVGPRADQVEPEGVRAQLKPRLNEEAAGEVEYKSGNQRYLDYKCPFCSRWSRIYPPGHFVPADSLRSATEAPPALATPPQPQQSDLAALNMARPPSSPSNYIDNAIDESNYSSSNRFRGRLADVFKTQVRHPPLIKDGQRARPRSNVNVQHPPPTSTIADQDEPGEMA